jgi:CRP/FNR family cyclic AMP-dependent transcriptional regulator
VSLQHFASQAMAMFMGDLSSPIALAGLCALAAAATFNITSSFVKTMVPLRGLAVLSNVGFMIYGLLHPLPIMALLHATLLPINFVRFSEMLRLTRRVRAASQSADLSGLWLKPYMKASRKKAGEVLFAKGDTADHLYYLAEGRIEIVEIGQTLEAGRMFGEIAFFSPSRRRTATARCLDDCLVLSVNEHTVRELYYQNPSFGFELVGLVAARLSADSARLSADVERLQAQLAQYQTAN